MRVLLLSVLVFAVSALPAGADGPPALAPPQGEILREYDSTATGYLPGHRGVDVAGEEGSVVKATAAGEVTFAGQVAGRRVVTVTHPSGWRITFTQVAPSVRVGQQVAVGDEIGTVEAGDHCLQSCWHLGLTDGETYADPLGADGQLSLLPLGTEPEPPPAITNPITEGLPVSGPITSRFGMRTHPITGVYKLHDGTDIAAACGTPIANPAAGRVVSAGWDGPYGYRVIVDHGGWRTAYAHMSKLSVSAGDSVTAGMQLGLVGTTGRSTGCHLHWMGWRGNKLVDPAALG